MAKKKFKLEIELGNDAMQTPMDVCFALKSVVHELERNEEMEAGKQTIMDFNGNSVGHFRFTER